jgi:hypothetical protein
MNENGFSSAPKGGALKPWLRGNDAWQEFLEVPKMNCATAPDEG